MDNELLKFRILPILGVKNDVPPDDPSMLRMIAQNVALAHAADGENFNLKRQRNVCTKSQGYDAWSNSAIGSPARCHAIFELDDGTNRDQLVWENGRMFYYDATPDPVQVQDAYLTISSLNANVEAEETVTGDTTGTQATVVVGESTGQTTVHIKDVTGGTGDFSATESLTFSGGATANCDSVIQHTTFDNGAGDYYSVIKFGSYVIFTEPGLDGPPPYKWKNGEANLERLITKRGASEYYFKYLLEWQRRIIGAYTGQTNGDIEIRWTGALPTWTDLEFAAANQLYKPTTDRITGLSHLGSNRAIIYGDESISEIVYYPSATTPFGIILLVKGEGCHSPYGIVNYQGANWFFNKNMGFVRYLGGSKLTANDVISNDIEDWITGIDSRYYDRIIGVPVPLKNQIAWAVPLAGGALPSEWLVYDVDTGQWQREDRSCTVIGLYTKTAGGYQSPVAMGTNGIMYEETGEAYSGATNLDGYREEPIMDFGDPATFKRVYEVWFGITNGGNYSIDISWRTGDTVKELLAASYTSLGSISLNNPSEPKLSIMQWGRFHQMKWQTNLDDEKFGVNWIEFRYKQEGHY